MSNSFYTPSGNPATHAFGLSATVRNEFQAVSQGFDALPRITTTGNFDTVFAQLGNQRFTLPSSDGTLALLSDVGANTAAIALLAPKDSPTFTGTVTVPTPVTLDSSTTAVNSLWVANFLAAMGFVPAGTSPVTSVATRTGNVVLTHTDITDWNTASIAPLSNEVARATAVEAQALNNVGRNLFHNPLFEVRQRGTGPFTTNTYTADRWSMFFVNGTMSSSILPYSDANRAAIGDESIQLAFVSTVAGGPGAGDFSGLFQHIEGVWHLSNKTITISFWAHVAIGTPGTPRLGIGVRQSFGTGGSPSPIVDMPGQSVVLTTTPARYQVTFHVPSMSGKTLGTTANTSFTRIAFVFSSGTTNAPIFGSPGTQSDVFALGGMQCEIASSASPLEKPDRAQEVARCQRYYQTGVAIYGGYAPSAGAGLMFFTYPYQAIMRITPAVVISASGGSGYSAVAISSPGPTALAVSPTATGAGIVAFNLAFTASADF